MMSEILLAIPEEHLAKIETDIGICLKEKYSSPNLHFVSYMVSKYKQNADKAIQKAKAEGAIEALEYLYNKRLVDLESNEVFVMASEIEDKLKQMEA